VDAAIALLQAAVDEYDAHIAMMCEMRDRLRGEIALAQLHRAAGQPAPDVAGHIDLTDAVLNAPVCLASRR
jgi:hypothetical protein